VQEPESIQESMEKFFLSKDTKKSEVFEKESLDNDFLIVKPCDKKPGKVIHKGKPQQASKKVSATETESKVLLSEMLGLQPKVPPKKEEQKEKTPDVWNYLEMASAEQ